MLFIMYHIFYVFVFQIVSGDMRGISQASVSRIVTRVSKIIALHLGQYINFSTQEHRRHNMNQFYNIARFPSVIGCIDCTHIRIVNPGGNNGEVFRNRKGWFSLNVQVCFLICIFSTKKKHKIKISYKMIVCYRLCLDHIEKFWT